MRSGKLIGTLVALSFASWASAQTPAPKPKAATKKPAPAAKAAPKPAPKTAEPAPAPAPPPPPATDVKIRTKYVNGAQVTENTTYIKGVRERFEFPGLTTITQCDLKRNVQLHDGTKHFLVVSTETPAAPPAPAPAPDAEMAAQMAAMSGRGGPGAAPAKPQGGIITETITLTDTGERKQMFGLEARHIKTVTLRQPGPNACETKSSTVETDGWYTDLPEHPTCPAVPAPAAPAPAAGQQTCTDRVVTQQVGDAKLGFALSTAVTTTVTDPKEKEKDVTTMTVEVTDLQVTSLDKALFDVPSDYTEVKTYQALLPSIASGGSLADAVFGSIKDGTSTVAPKQAGVIRIGVVDPTIKVDRQMSDLMLRGSLLGSFTKAPFESVPVSGATLADVDRDAARNECDFILVSDIAELKTSKPNKVGGMLRKVSGDTNAATEIHEARIDYKVYAVGDQAKPRITSSVKVNSGGGFGVGSALRLAAFAGSMYLTMGMGGGMMGMMGGGSSFGGLGGLGGGMMAGRMNPGMNVAMSMMSQAQMGGMGMGGVPGVGGDQSAEKVQQTVQDGLSKAGKQVADELKKSKQSASTDKKK